MPKSTGDRSILANTDILAQRGTLATVLTKLPWAWRASFQRLALQCRYVLIHRYRDELLSVPTIRSLTKVLVLHTVGKRVHAPLNPLII